MTTPNSNESDDSLDTNKDGEGSVSAAQNENRNADELLSISLIEKLKTGSDLFSVHRCIYKIPPYMLRKQNEKAFIPSVVSIGPFHHGKENLKGMEKIKLHYLSSLLIDRKPPLETKMEDLVKGIRPIESACRDCYGEKVDFSNDEFVEMMVIDGCFVLEFLRRFGGYSPVHGDLLFSNAGIVWEVTNDLLLLENQLPWRVLECLFDLTSESAMFPLPMLILNFLKSYVLLSPKPSGKLKNRHLLDFIRNSLLGSYEESQSDDDSIVSDLIPSVTVLRLAGVKFKCGKEEDNSMLNITFKNGVLEIPPILVLEENRESLFGNLIAYEQCQPSLGYQITSYVVVLDNLIKSNKDVEFLVEKKIMRKIFSRKDMASFFSRVYKDTRLYNFAYLELQKQVNTFCAGGWHKWKMILRRDYFKNPCSSCSSSS